LFLFHPKGPSLLVVDVIRPIAARALPVLQTKVLSAHGAIARAQECMPSQQCQGSQAQHAAARFFPEAATTGVTEPTKAQLYSAAKIDVIKESFTAKLLGSAGAAA